MNISYMVERACEHLLAIQNEDGSWDMSMSDINIPPFFNHKIVRTGESLRALILSKNRAAIKSIQKGLTYALNLKLKDDDNINFHCARLKVLRFIDSKFAKEEAKKHQELVLNLQDKNGYWPLFPGTYNLLNFSVLDALYFDSHSKESLSSLSGWWINNRAKDGVGWGYDDSSEQSENTYTADVLMGLAKIDCNVDINILNKARDFLISNQNPDGGFVSSKTTIDDTSTVYATSLAIIVMLLYGDDPNSQALKKALKFLENSQLDEGGWGILEGDSKLQIYATYYSIFALRLYDYFDSAYKNSKFNFAKKNFAFNKYIFTLFEMDYLSELSLNFLKSNYSKLGQTSDSNERRKDILKILNEAGFLDHSQIIDHLKQNKKYDHLKKKYHGTLIKNDLEFLKSNGLVKEFAGKFCLLMNLVN